MGEQIVAAARVVGEYAHPNAAANTDLLAIDQERLLESRQHPARDGVRFHACIHAVDEEPERVTADASERVGNRYRGLEAMSDLDQHAIADAVAVRLVDGAEPIEVDGGDGDRSPGGMPLGERSRQPLLEEIAVGEPGERIVRGDVVQAGVGFRQIVPAAAGVLLELLLESRDQLPDDERGGGERGDGHAQKAPADNGRSATAGAEELPVRRYSGAEGENGQRDHHCEHQPRPPRDPQDAMAAEYQPQTAREGAEREDQTADTPRCRRGRAEKAAARLGDRPLRAPECQPRS